MLYSLCLHFIYTHCVSVRVNIGEVTETPCRMSNFFRFQQIHEITLSMSKSTTSVRKRNSQKTTVSAKQVGQAAKPTDATGMLITTELSLKSLMYCRLAVAERK